MTFAVKGIIMIVSAYMGEKLIIETTGFYPERERRKVCS